MASSAASKRAGATASLAGPDALAVKVLRLPAPNAARTPTIPWRLDETCAHSIAPLGSLLTVPLTMGAVYVGQLFRACVCVANILGGDTVTDISVRLELQTASHRIPLFDTAVTGQGEDTMDAGAFRSFVVSHALTESGLHCLVASIDYSAPVWIAPTVDSNGTVTATGYFQPQPKTVQKFFKFPVLDPLTVTSQAVRRDDLSLVECAVTNAMDKPIILHPPTLEAARQSDTNRDQHEAKILEAKATRAFLMQVNETATASASLGRALLVYSSSLGEVCRFYSAPIPRPPPLHSQSQTQSRASASALDCRVHHCPSTVTLERAFSVEFELINTHPSAEIRDACVQGLRDRQGSLICYGAARTSVARIPPQSSCKVSLTFTAIGLGMHRITGIRCEGFMGTDGQSLQHEFDALTPITVNAH